MKIAIVGPEESKWTKEQKFKAKNEIEFILTLYHTNEIPSDYGHWYSYKNITLVSGHCPKGGVDIWAEEIADELDIKKEIYPAEAKQWSDGERVNCLKCDFIWDCNKPMKDALYYLNKHSLECNGELIFTKMKGYKSRNIQIAETCDVLYCIVPQTYIPTKEEKQQGILADYPSDIYCWHCGNLEGLGHPRNGGCWTMKKAKSLGKETHLEVIT